MPTYSTVTIYADGREHTHNSIPRESAAAAMRDIAYLLNTDSDRTAKRYEIRVTHAPVLVGTEWLTGADPEPGRWRVEVCDAGTRANWREAYYPYGGPWNSRAAAQAAINRHGIRVHDRRVVSDA